MARLTRKNSGAIGILENLLSRSLDTSPSRFAPFNSYFCRIKFRPSWVQPPPRTRRVQINHPSDEDKNTKCIEGFSTAALTSAATRCQSPPTELGTMTITTAIGPRLMP